MPRTLSDRRRLSLLSRKGSAMTVPQTYEFQPFCYKHQVEMKPKKTLPATAKGPTQGITFACPKPDCFLHYNRSRGYFLLTQNTSGNWDELEPGLLVRCEKDRSPMFLSEFFPDRWSLRLWKCPLCKTVRANAEISAAQESSRAQ